MSKPDAKRRYRLRRRARAVEAQRQRNSAALFTWLWQRQRAGIVCEVAPFGVLPYVDKEGKTVHAFTFGGKVFMSQESFDALRFRKPLSITAVRAI